MNRNTKKLDIIIDKVEDYLVYEYDSMYVAKMNNKKHKEIIHSYIKNCVSINKTVPYIAQGIVRYFGGIQ